MLNTGQQDLPTESSLFLSIVLFGKWTDHVKSWRKNDLGDRILFVTYEEMVKVSHFLVLRIPVLSV